MTEHEDEDDFAFPSDGAAKPPCAQHPDVTSTFTCTRCGDFRCIRCLSLRGSDLCMECAELVIDAHSASRWAVAAAVFGFLGVGCAPIGWPGIIAGVVDLVISARTGRTGGRMLSVIGIVLGTIGTVLWVYAIGNAMMMGIEDPTYYDDY